MERAFACRYGGQSLGYLLGSDKPLSDFELRIFNRCVLEHVKLEVQPLGGMGVAPVPSDE